MNQSVLLAVMIVLLLVDIIFTRRWFRETKSYGEELRRIRLPAGRRGRRSTHLWMEVKLTSDVNPDRLPAVLGIIASQLHDADGRRQPAYTRYPLRDEDGLITGSWVWGFGGDLQ